MTRRDQFIDGAKQRLQAHSIESINHHFDDFLHTAETCCQSEIEVLFFLAWMEILERRRILMDFLWMHSMYLVFDQRLNATLEDVIKEQWLHPLLAHWHGFTQIDLVFPQQVIGDYRVDFVLMRLSRNFHGKERLFQPYAQTYPLVVVECDGHPYHDRTPEQAERDKSRDRRLQTDRFNVLRFTGREIMRSPESCAIQVDEFFENNAKQETDD